jgi:uncharacterized protein
MDVFSHFLAVCRSGFAMLGAEAGSLPASLLLAGLAGSLIHCVGMCGPFVLGQVVSGTEGERGPYGEWRRLAGAALMPYHLGRLTTYTILGALAGGVTSIFASTAAFVWLSAGLLCVAALLMLAQAIGLATGMESPWSTALARIGRPLTNARGTTARYALGVLLGFLPCGLLYGALAGAAGSGSPATGALAMAAFTAGTMPALIAVGWGGLIARRQLRRAGRWIAIPLLLANAIVMLALASSRF